MKFCLIVLCLPLIVSGLNAPGFHYPKAQLIRYNFCKKKLGWYMVQGAIKNLEKYKFETFFENPKKPKTRQTIPEPDPNLTFDTQVHH